MLKLAICDDNVLFLEEMKNMLKEDHRVKDVITFDNPDDLMDVIEKRQCDYDAVFMDINFDRKENGIQYAKEIFKIEPQLQIVYVTGFGEEYIQQIFLTDANLTGYLMKPLEKGILEQYLDKIYEKKYPQNVLTFAVRGKTIIVATDQILYLESDNHKVIIHTEAEEYSVYDKLCHLYEQLPDDFIQTHKSFVVNMDKISLIEGSEICLLDGSRIPVSKIHQAKVKKTYFQYLGKKI